MLEKIRQLLSDLYAFLLAYSSRRASNKATVIDTRMRNEREKIAVQTKARRVELDFEDDKNRHRIVFVRERIALRQEFWTQVIGKFSEFWERFSTAWAEWYQRRKIAKADYLKVKQEAKAQVWAERRKTFVRLFRTLRTEFSRLIKFMRAVVKSDPDVFKKFAAKITGSSVLLLILVFFLLVGIAFSKPLVWKLALIGLVLVVVIRIDQRKEVKTAKGKRKGKTLARRLIVRYLLWRRSMRRRKLPIVTWGKSFLLALAFLALTLFGIIIGNNTIGVWIKAFAPVGVVWSMFLPILVRKSFPALVGKFIVIFPTCLWIGMWLVYRFK